jgi:hypothetical protein
MDAYITEALNKCFHDHEMQPYKPRGQKMEIEGEKVIKSRIS